MNGYDDQQPPSTADRERRKAHDELVKSLQDRITELSVQRDLYAAENDRLTAEWAALAIQNEALARLRTPEVVEVAAEAAFFSDDINHHHRLGPTPHTWRSIPEIGRENYRVLVRDVLSAALEAAGGQS